MTDTPIPRAADRVLDAPALKALAHPLRVELYDALASFGPATASGLAERLGESSGSTSYHLRQLARHGLVREVEGRGSARERWWERTPGSISVSIYDQEQESGRAAAHMVLRQWERSRALLIDDFQSRPDALGREWYEATAFDTINVSATPAELRAVVDAFTVFMHEHIEPLRARDGDPDARRVQVHFNAFPILDGLPQPSERD